jgi:NADPH:quinone reductase-like Zn-dependent oxidoreductase
LGIAGDDDVGLRRALNMQINPLSALLMAKSLDGGKNAGKNGSVVITAARSSVALDAMRIVKHSYGSKVSKVIGVVRRNGSPDDEWNDEKERLIGKGYDIILSEDEVKRTPPRKLVTTLGLTALVLDSVGGQLLSRLSNSLSQNTDVVVYGGLSKESLSVNVSTLIFKGISYSGFWLNNITITKELKIQYFKQLLDMYDQGVLEVPETECYDLNSFKEAVERVGRGKKIMLRLKK